MQCPIWGTEATEVDRGSGAVIVDSPRAGGRYFLDAPGNGKIVSFTNEAKLLLTTWLCDQRHAGVQDPRIDGNVLDLVRSRRPLQVSEKLTRGLQFLGRKLGRLGSAISLGDGGNDSLQALAETETLDIREQIALFRMLRDIGVIEGTFFGDGKMQVAPTASGWQQLFQLNQSLSSSSLQAFVAMWFNPSMEDAYVDGIAPAIADAGYSPFRVDKKEHNNKIDDEIVAEIRRSRFVVADFTCETEKPRGGVYYEAGFAHGLGIPVIWTCRKSSMGDLHFDTRQYAHIVWETPSDLRTQLRNRIGATIQHL
ncbi:MAG: hypothetical protein AB7O50_12660 [Pseudolabrys sp.]